MVDAPVTNRGGGTTPRMRRGKAPREGRSGWVPARTRRESAASTAGAPSRAVLFEALAAESVIRITPFDLRARLSVVQDAPPPPHVVRRRAASGTQSEAE